MVTESRRCLEPDCMAIHWFGKFEVQESVVSSGPPNRGVEIQGKLDLAMGTIFCGERSDQLLLVPVSQPNLGYVDNSRVHINFE